MVDTSLFLTPRLGDSPRLRLGDRSWLRLGDRSWRSFGDSPRLRLGDWSWLFFMSLLLLVGLSLDQDFDLDLLRVLGDLFSRFDFDTYA